MSSILSWAKLLSRRFSTRSYKQCNKEIIHPYVNEPENLSLTPRYCEAITQGRQIYLPKNFYNELAVESKRSGDFLGDDFPYNFLGKERLWRKRKYNVIVNPIPNCVSRAKCVNYYHRLQVWSTHWLENGIHRSRWFKCGYGFLRAKRAAEQFRKDLISFGRVDHLKTKEQKRLDLEKWKAIRDLKRKRL